MRSDFGRVIIDCYRGGLHISMKKARKGRWRERRRDHELAAQREPMARWRGSKYLCDHLSPLKRYLFGQVGRPWDKVWSEICAHIPVDGLMQQHVRNHVFDFVLVSTKLKDGEIWVDHFRGPARLDEVRTSRSFLYVSPKSGLLQRVERVRERRRLHLPDPKIPIEGGRSLEQIDGLWFVWEPRVVRVRGPEGVDKQQQLVKRQLSRKEVALLVPSKHRSRS